MRRSVRLKYLSQSGTWPSGHPRMYFRFRGHKCPLPDAALNSPSFLDAYGIQYRELVGADAPSKEPATGTIAAAIRAFQNSEDFRSWASNTRSARRRAFADFAVAYGSGRLADLRPRHIRQDLYPYPAHPANSRLKAWRALCKWCHANGFMETNPAIEVVAKKVPKSDGHTPWTRKNFVTYRNFWPIGTPQRLGFEIMYLTCAAIGDACRLGPGNIHDGWIIYRRQKSASTATCPFSAAAPHWSEPDDCLAVALEARTPGAAVWLTTVYGTPRSPKSAAQWFSKSCTRAGLEELTAHGIRKGRAAVFKENGATLDQRLAWLGQETESEGRRYSKSADLRRVIESGDRSANPPQPSANFSR